MAVQLEMNFDVKTIICDIQTLINKLTCLCRDTHVSFADRVRVKQKIWECQQILEGHKVPRIIDLTNPLDAPTTPDYTDEGIPY